ncbi:MAG: hypothetical protein HKN50_12975 [Gammaproteobacteria bacterium]|nr:hypothetical protein [Gammaproteobacteria bacterium]
MTIRFLCALFLLSLTSPAVAGDKPAEGAIDKAKVAQIIEQAYPGAMIKEIEKERFKGEPVYEVDFKHEGQKLEALISLDGNIVKVAEDD